MAWVTTWALRLLFLGTVKKKKKSQFRKVPLNLRSLSPQSCLSTEKAGKEGAAQEASNSSGSSVREWREEERSKGVLVQSLQSWREGKTQEKIRAAGTPRRVARTKALCSVLGRHPGTGRNAT